MTMIPGMLPPSSKLGVEVATGGVQVNVGVELGVTVAVGVGVGVLVAVRVGGTVPIIVGVGVGSEQ